MSIIFRSVIPELPVADVDAALAFYREIAQGKSKRLEIDDCGRTQRH